MIERTTIDVILVEPMKAPKSITIEDKLEAMQELVGGLIEEYMPFEDDVALVCNDEGKLNKLPLNRGIKDNNGQLVDVIAGPFFIAYAPIESENFLSLPNELKEKYMKKFKAPEKFRMTDAGIKVSQVTPDKEELER